ncbi:MAG TPA: protein kinase [Thermoanaerobaculia bacterium]|nr:protein kinase [Thermoanaerobaculia bacterium]
MNDSGSETLARSLTAGTLVGQYEIVSFIGAGGMGEVYKAHDQRVGRDVAIKIIPSRFGKDHDRVRRFAQESRTMARVNHPNIVSMFDVGEHEGRSFIVSELLEGETLRQYMGRAKQMPVRKVVEFGIQMARALAAAHEKEIVHRDLKPANVFITKDEHLKILDFGLAKLAHTDWERDSGSDTISAVSLPGTILGSVGYMSPEQVEARLVDHRSDIFSLGVILYEMLTDVRAFSGTSVPATLGAILKDQPRDVSEIRSDVPTALVVIIRRCLEKEADNRFQSARDLAFSLEELTNLSDPSFSSMTRSAMRAAMTRMRAQPRIGIVTAVVVVVIVIGIAAMNSGSAEPRPSRPRPPAALRLTRVTSSGNVLATDGGPVGVSPDATYAAYLRKDGDESSIWLHHIPTGSEVQLAPRGAYDSVRISPDRNFVYYTAAEKGSLSLYRVPLLGGNPRKIADDVNWSSAPAISRTAAKIAFTRNGEMESSVWVANSDGGGARQVLAVLRKDTKFRSCAWSPDATQLACTAEKKAPLIVLMIIDVATGRFEERHGFFTNYLSAFEWADDGNLVGAGGSGIWKIALTGEGAQRLTNDLSGYADLTLARDSRAICTAQMNTTYNLYRVPVDPPGAPQLILSGFNTQDGKMGIFPLRDGRFVYSSAASGKSLDLWISNADGSGRRRLTEDDGSDEVRPQVSNDETFLVYIRRSEESAYELWRADLNGENGRKLTDHAEGPGIAPDGQWVYFTRNEASGPHLYRIPSTGGEVTRVFDRRCAHISIAPNGKWLMASCEGKTVVFSVDQRGKEKVFSAAQPHRWRPDSQAFAYADDTKERNIWLQPLDGGAPRQLTSFSDQGLNFEWARDGKSLYVPRWQTATDIVLLNESQ